MTNQIPDQNGQQADNTQVPPVAPHDSVPQAEAPQQPYQAPQYQQPQGEQYQQPQYAAPQANNVGGTDLGGTVVLNYWLSVFFAWLPALIFYFTEKGKSQLSDQYHRENLNFSLLRTGAMIIALFIIWIPWLGQLVYLIVWIGGLVLHLLVAVKAKERFENGEAPGFLFNLKMVK